VVPTRAGEPSPLGRLEDSVAINNARVITGGLAAGLVLNILDFLSNMFIMATRFKTELDALNPGLMAKMEEPAAMGAFIALDFVFGLLLVWTYAAIRPRFGAGVGTAVKAGILAWAVSGTTWFFTVAMGLFSIHFFLLSAAISLVSMLISAYVGAMLYKED
jgi:hypothetical protein